MEIREEFNFLWQSKAQNLTVVAARGTGKTVAALQYLVWALLTSPYPNCQAIFMSSTLERVKTTVIPPMREIIEDYPDKFCVLNKVEHAYRFKVGAHDIREILLLSYENEESKRGLHPRIIVLDECASMPNGMYDTIISPMMTDTECKLIAIGTPQGHNKFYDFFRRGMSSDFPSWESYRIRASDTKVFSPEFLWNQRNNLTAAAYAQEYECDFDANVLVGSVYGEYMDKFTFKNIQDYYTWDPNVPVYTAWDLGFSDYTAIWFFQVKGDVVTFIDYYENNGQDIGYYANVLRSKPYMYRTMILPHDGGASNIRGAPIREQLNKYGFHCEVLPIRKEQEGIDEARRLLKTCRFDSAACRVGLVRLKQFKYRLDKSTGEKMGTLHDENSHAADAFRYAAMSRDIWGIEGQCIKIVPRQDYSVLC